jgi:hypothetical protein
MDPWDACILFEPAIHSIEIDFRQSLERSSRAGQKAGESYAWNRAVTDDEGFVFGDEESA